MSVAMICKRVSFATVNIKFLCTYRTLGHYIEGNIEPSWKMGSTHLGEVHARDRAEFDTQRLKIDGDNVGEQYDKKELELMASTSRHICGIVSRVDICNRYLRCVS